MASCHDLSEAGGAGFLDDFSVYMGGKADDDAARCGLPGDGGIEGRGLIEINQELCAALGGELLRIAEDPDGNAGRAGGRRDFRGEQQIFDQGEDRRGIFHGQIEPPGEADHKCR